MNYQDYNEYMRNMFRYQNNDPYSDALEKMYPEVYKIVYPMIGYACDNISMPVTETMVDIITNDIYDRLEADGRINIEVTFEANFNNTQLNNNDIPENNKRVPRRRNRFLRDLIKILLLRELLNRHHNYPIRPF